MEWAREGGEVSEVDEHWRDDDVQWSRARTHINQACPQFRGDDNDKGRKVLDIMLRIPVDGL